MNVILLRDTFCPVTLSYGQDFSIEALFNSRCIRKFKLSTKCRPCTPDCKTCAVNLFFIYHKVHLGTFSSIDQFFSGQLVFIG